MLISLLKKKYIVLFILLILVATGIYISYDISVDIFPNLNYPLFNIITHYDTGAPEDVETLISKPIESQLSGINHIRRISSISQEGLSQVTVEFDWGIKVNDARQQVSQALSVALPMLPDGAKPVIENLGSNLQEIVGYGVIPDEGVDIANLTYLIKTKIANHLKSINGVSRIEVIGGEKKVYLISPKIDQIMKYHISLSEIADIIKANNFQIMEGYMDKNYKDYAVRGINALNDIQNLGNISIKTFNGIPVFLKDIATIKESYLPKRYTVYIDGKPGIAFSVFKVANASTMEVSRNVAKKLKEIKGYFANKAKIEKYYDQSELIGEAANNLKHDILFGSLLVILVLLIFFAKLKEAFLIAITIPITAIISFIVFKMENLSFNMITLGAMAVAVGMIVDDSIIVLENIVRYKELGKSSFKAVILGTKEIFSADLTGTLTTVATFIPFSFLSGLAGRFTISFALVMITVLLISLIISLTLIPLVMNDRGKYTVKKPIASFFVFKFIKLNQKILKFFLRHKAVVLVLLFIVFIVSAGGLFFNPVSFLPQIDEGAILLEYVLPPGTSLSESNRIGMLLEKIALKSPNVKTVYRRTGSESGSFQVEPVNRGELVIKLIPRNKRKEEIFQVIKDLKKISDKIPGIITFYHQVSSEKMDESLSGLPTVFGVTIFGEDYNKLTNYADKIEKIASQTSGIGSIINNTKYKVPEFIIKADPEKSGHFGLNPKNILKELQFYFSGKTVTDVLEKEHTIPIFLKADKSINNMEDLKSIYMKKNNDYIPMSELTKHYLSYGSNTITHINLQREITLPMEIDGMVNGIIKRLKKQINKLDLPSGYSVEFGGQYKLFTDMLKKIIFLILISLFIIYLIMAIQFNNFIHPLVIMAEIPFSFIGAFLAIEISKQTLNISFIIGLITLVGVSVNNGIVLIDFINKKRKNGISREKAIYEATRIRTRPIILTALTSMLALFPVSLGLGIGSKIHQSLAIAVIGGLILNTIFTLNLLPVVYCVLEDILGKRKKRLANRIRK